MKELTNRQLIVLLGESEQKRAVMLEWIQNHRTQCPECKHQFPLVSGVTPT